MRAVHARSFAIWNVLFPDLIISTMPFTKVKYLVAACSQGGVRPSLWQNSFLGFESNIIHGTLGRGEKPLLVILKLMVHMPH